MVSCTLYSSYVALRWTGHSPGTTYSACYTSWSDPSDIVKVDLPLSVSSQLTTYYPSRSIDGFSCDGSLAFCTNLLPSSWWRIDLQSSIYVKRVMVIKHGTSNFQNVKVHIIKYINILNL